MLRWSAVAQWKVNILVLPVFEIVPFSHGSGRLMMGNKDCWLSDSSALCTVNPGNKKQADSQIQGQTLIRGKLQPLCQPKTLLIPVRTFICSNYGKRRFKSLSCPDHSALSRFVTRVSFSAAAKLKLEGRKFLLHLKKFTLLNRSLNLKVSVPAWSFHVSRFHPPVTNEATLKTEMMKIFRKVWIYF